ncbi:MAG: 7-cyano-7-deazaguanine synthase QueC [Thermoplasmatota archaeon]
MRPARDGGSRGAEKAVVLLSGGMDSAAAAAVARVRGFEIYALTVDYGQRHRRELGCARRLARFFGAREHRVIRSGLGELGGSALTDRSIAVPEGKEWRPGARVPATYVPARNLVLLSLAAAYAETLGAGAIFIGANAVDYSGYPDCRPGFLRAFERALRLGTARGSSGLPIRILAPLMRVSKAGIVRLGVRLGVPFELTWSCYRGGRRPCGRCDACRLRAGGFRDAGLEDPLERATRARGTGHVGSPRERVQEGTGRRRAPGRRGCGN